MQRIALPALETAATLLLGLMSGFFFAFAIDVAPAMSHLDAAGYISTQQWINKVVRNAGFGAAYFGATVLAFAAAAAALMARQRRRAIAWAAIALIYAAAVFWVTRSVNVPINNALALWNPQSPPADWIEARDVWNQSNLLRSIAAALCFAAALVCTRSAAASRPA